MVERLDKKSDNSKISSQPAEADNDLIPVIAIGASAGGLEPMEQFFDSMAVDAGCAFVIIQHLSPDFRSLMDELLARHSSMNIHRVTNGIEIEPNSIYLNPARSIMTLSGNKLLVEKTPEQDTVYLPIDLFFNSLAQERREKAIGLVLSGTGSDGTRGCQSISELNGTVLVQDPTTTRFDGMPRSVLSDGHFTLIGSPSTLALSVKKLLNNESLDNLDSGDRLPIKDPLSDLLSMLKHRYGTDFLKYKEATIHRRIERRAQLRGITEIEDYRDILHTDELELQDLYDDLLIEVTEFFRDPAAFDLLQSKVLPELTADLKDGSALRVWVPGCASGEEAYSIAILLQEQARARGIYLHLKILATDIHIRSMNQASSGIYPESALSSVPKELVDRYFDCADGQAQIKPSVRNMVFFSTHDVMRDPPFTRIDLISCRNLLIYLKEPAQDKVLNLLHFSLRKGGVLFLGPSEHIGSIAYEFDVINEKWRIYKKRRDVKLLPAESIFAGADVAGSLKHSSGLAHRQPAPNRSAPLAVDDTVIFKRARNAALENIVADYAPPGFLLTDGGTIVHIFGDAGRLLPMQSGSFSRNITDLIRPDLKVIVTSALDNGRNAAFTGFRRAAYIRDDDGKSTTFEVRLNNLELPGEVTRFQLLAIEEISESNAETVVINRAKNNDELHVYESNEALQQRIAILEHSLQSSEESLQSTIEELETSNEELQSTNEELMATNEELQSTNEELHSVNEELYTVSAEHQRKNEQLTERDTDIDVLLQSSKIGSLHLDKDLRLRRYTNKARTIFNIMPLDVGRPITHISIRTSEQEILSLINDVYDTQATHETRVKVDGEVYLLRILPYKRDTQIFQGVMITVIDITDLENMRFALDELSQRYKDIIENTDSYILRWNAKNDVVTYCNQPFADRWNTTIEKSVGRPITDIRNFRSQQLAAEFIKDIKPGSYKTGVYTDYGLGNEKRSSMVTVRAISADNLSIDEYQTTGFDITEEQQYTDSLTTLHTIFADDTIDNNKKIENILAVGLDYFQLDTALVSLIVDQDYTVKAVQSKLPVSLKVNDVLNLEETICGQMPDGSMAYAVDNLTENGMGDLKCVRITGIQSFLGAVIQTTSGPYGTVSFSSLAPRGKAFSPREQNLALTISGWIGFILGNIEQLEFISSQNEYYQSLFKKIPAMMFLADADGLIISASDRLCENLGLTPEALPGELCSRYFQKNEAEKVIEILNKGNASKVPFTLLGKSNKNLEIELSSSVKPIGTMQETRMVILNDVSERNQASRDATEKNRKLELANESLNQFAFIASHDLQEPLRKIQQFSSFLADDLGELIDKDAQYHIDVIIDASQRMSTLIHDLLHYSGASKENPTLEPVSLNNILDNVVHELQLPIEESGAQIELKLLPTIDGNRPLLTQLFTNLVGNSIKYRSAERAPKITVSGFGKNNKEGILIVDNGIGFDMTYAKKIFEPFIRLHNSKSYKGNGVGLAICAIVCEKHGWHITANSHPERGSEFKIYFQKQ